MDGPPEHRPCGPTPLEPPGGSSETARSQARGAPATLSAQQCEPPPCEGPRAPTPPDKSRSWASHHSTPPGSELSLAQRAGRRGKRAVATPTRHAARAAPGWRPLARPDPFQNHWTLELEAIARRTMKQASGYAWMYERMVARAKNWGNVLTILTGALAAIVGTQGLISAFTAGATTPFWAGALTALVGYAIAVLTALNGTWKLDVVRSEGLVAQVDFAHLARSIQFQLALRPSERQDARDFVKGVLNEIETLKLSSPTIDNAVSSRYIAKFKDNPIYNPSEQWEDLRGAVPAQAPPGFAGGSVSSSEEDSDVVAVSGWRPIAVGGARGFDADNAPAAHCTESPRWEGSRRWVGPLGEVDLELMLDAYEAACGAHSS